MRKIGILTIIVLCGAMIVGGVIYFTHARKDQKSVVVKDKLKEQADLERTGRLLSQGKVEDALTIIHNYEDEIGTKTDNGRKWLDYLISASMKSANFGQLIILYEAYPRAFENNELASLMVGDAYILAKRPQDYGLIRAEWTDKSTLKDMWIVLDADQLLLEGKKEDALHLLKTNKFEGKKDIDRLVRLALLYVVESPKVSWDYLSEAYNIDPQNADILTYRAKLLESLGKDSLALYEYLAAIQVAPDNLFLRDQLAEFYMRRNQTALALSIWLETLSKPSLDLIWIKALFWSKVATPVTFDWAKATAPTGGDKPFIEYLLALPTGTYWDEDAFNKIPNGKKFLSNLQVTYWFRLLEALKNGNENEAQHLLQFNNFSKNLLNPQLNKALKQIVSYRKKGTLNFEINLLEKGGKKELDHKTEPVVNKENQTFFEVLDSQAAQELDTGSTDKLPPELHDLLTSNEAFAAAFLAAGWTEAALQLHKMPVLPNSFPDWVAFGLAQAYRSNRNAAEALDFALKQKKSPSLSLLIGELYIADNKPDEALKILTPYLNDKTDLGYRASWLASVIYADKQEYDMAKKIIMAQPKLADDAIGKEALARIALLQGNEELADQLYSQLQDSSPEAMSYLARKAFADKNWNKAQELTEKLLLMFPDSPILRDNLNKIVEEQKAQNAL